MAGGAPPAERAGMDVPVGRCRPATTLTAEPGVGTATTVIDVPSTAAFAGAFCAVVLLVIALSIVALRATHGRRNLRPMEEG